jgi:hypothetical protein
MSSFGSAIRRVLSQPAFLTVTAVLLLAAVSLNGTARYMKLHFRKDRVELRKKLTELPPVVGAWRQVSTDTAINPETEEVLGTKDYIFRTYVDTRSPAVTPALLEGFKDQNIDQQERLAARIQSADPYAVLRVAVTYYTGMVDTVAHIPNRCYVADGYEPARDVLASWECLASRPGSGKVNYINFEDATPQRRAVTKNVAYFFHSNGEYVSDPLGVRKKLQNLMETHAYYAKVELLLIADNNEMVEEKMNDFLTSALPEIEKCLPDWQQVKAAKKK